MKENIIINNRRIDDIINKKKNNLQILCIKMLVDFLSYSELQASLKSYYLHPHQLSRKGVREKIHLRKPEH